MPKIIYEYVMFYSDDVAQLPIFYPSIKELSNIFNLSTQSIHKKFNLNNPIYIENYGIERFKKEFSNDRD